MFDWISIGIVKKNMNWIYFHRPLKNSLKTKSDSCFILLYFPNEKASLILIWFCSVCSLFLSRILLNLTCHIKCCWLQMFLVQMCLGQFIIKALGQRLLLFNMFMYVCRIALRSNKYYLLFWWYCKLIKREMSILLQASKQRKSLKRGVQA